MANVSITLTVLRGSIPSACYVDGAGVTAAIVLVDGLSVLDLQIADIDAGTGDTDEVTFNYDDLSVPADVVLSECNFASFQCVCDCCAEKRCFEIIGPNANIVDGSYHVAFIPADLLVDQIRIYSPSPSDINFNFTLYANGVAVTQTTPTTGLLTVIERSAFAEAFQSGVIPEDAELFVNFNGAPSAGDVWSGFSLCLLGRWLA